MRSSYKENNYGNVLTALVIGKKPEMCVELGVLDGYSSIHIGLALQFNNRVFGIDGRLYCWDLFDKYPYKHGFQEEVEKRINEQGLTPIVKLAQGDAFEVHKLIQAGSVDFMHVDISNDGKTLRHIMEFWSHKMKPWGMIAFEGGSKERDNVEWMIKYNKESIFEELKNNITINQDFNYYNFTKFPSLTILQKKGCFT